MRSATGRAGAALAASAAILGAAWLGAPGPAPGPARVATFEPAGDAAPLERLPGGARESRALRLGREQSSGGGDALALELARRHLDAARATGDPREAGRALAALARRADDPSPPADVRVVRAAVAQHLHAFDAAIAELDAVLEREPGHLQARWLRASVLRAIGRLDEAAADCAALAGAGASAPASAHACVADLASLRGDRAASGALEARLAAHPPAASERGWIDLVRAEIAEREGRGDDALRAYRTALLRGADGPYARVAFADALMDRGRLSEALAVIDGAPATDAVEVLRAIALARAGDERAEAAARAVRARFAAEDARDVDPVRDDARHLRERARFALDVERAPRAALALAERNWARQKEPADARLLLRAAAAAGRDAAAAPVRAFVARHRITDVRLERP
jgi:tetratricopeptide (TPR) repeat protein